MGRKGEKDGGKRGRGGGKMTGRKGERRLGGISREGRKGR